MLDAKIQEKYLNNIQREDLLEVAKQFNPTITLNDKQRTQLFELTDGNLELIKESLDLFQTNVITISHNFYNIIEMNISNLCDKSKETLELLKQAAFIGDEMDSRLLKSFSNMAADIYEQILDKAIELCYLKEENYSIRFLKNMSMLL